jgi:hypothetical protein
MQKKLALLLALLFPLSVMPQNPRVESWAQSFYIDAKLDQQYLNVISSFLGYLMSKDPSQESFTKEHERVGKAFKGLPKYVKQSMVRLFSNSQAQAVRMGKDGEANTEIWQISLMEYYREVYPLLDQDHQTYTYGKRKGEPLPSINN